VFTGHDPSNFAFFGFSFGSIGDYPSKNYSAVIYFKQGATENAF